MNYGQPGTDLQPDGSKTRLQLTEFSFLKRFSETTHNQGQTLGISIYNLVRNLTTPHGAL